MNASKKEMKSKREKTLTNFKTHINKDETQ